jgi:hypothetical protein
VHKGAPGGVVITSNQDGKNPLLRGAVLTITFDMRNSTHVTKRTIAHEVMCCVCMDRPPVVWQAGEQVACPLGHNAVCEECLPVLYQNRQPCPICREPWIAEAVAPIRERADAKARAELAAWRAAELEREAAELAHFQAMQAAEAAAEAAARAAALGQLCSKWGVDPDSPVYKAVEDMEQADQELVLRELHVVNVQLPFDPCDTLGRPVVMDGLARGAPKVGEPGVPCAKWLLRVSVRLHNGKNDELGDVLEVSDVSGILREYKVQPAMLIRGTIWNYSFGTINFTPVYINPATRAEEEGGRDRVAETNLISFASAKKQVQHAAASRAIHAAASTSLNNFLGPVGDCGSAKYLLLSPKS